MIRLRRLVRVLSALALVCALYVAILYGGYVINEGSAPEPLSSALPIVLGIAVAAGAALAWTMWRR